MPTGCLEGPPRADGPTAPDSDAAPVVIRARSEARSAAALAVSRTLAGTLKKLKLAIRAISCSLGMFILVASKHLNLLFERFLQCRLGQAETDISSASSRS